jgi:pilus assembly protein Flp/PilA
MGPSITNTIEKIIQFLKEEDGVEVVEWAIIIGLIAVSSLGLLIGLGLWVTNSFQALSTQIGS